MYLTNQHRENTARKSRETREKRVSVLGPYWLKERNVRADWTEQLTRAVILQTNLQWIAQLDLSKSLESCLSCFRRFLSALLLILLYIHCRCWVKIILMWQNSWTIWPCYVKTKENMTRYACWTTIIYYWTHIETSVAIVSSFFQAVPRTVGFGRGLNKVIFWRTNISWLQFIAQLLQIP